MNGLTKALPPRRLPPANGARLEALVQSIDQAVYEIDLAGACTFANRAGLALLGREHLDDLLGMNLHDLFHARPTESTAHRWEECQLRHALGRPTATHIGTEVFSRPDGSRVDVEMRCYPLMSQGRVRGVVLMCIDISEHRKRHEQSLFERVLLHSQSEASIDGILVVSSDTKMLSFNRRFIELWGVPKEIVDARSDEAALRWVLQKLVDPAAFIAKVQYLYAHQDEESRDFIELQDGRTFDRYSAPVKSPEGVYYGRVWFFRDVTQLKRAEAELNRLYAEAREAVRIRDEFLSIASHELKTPLTSLQLQTDSLLAKVQNNQLAALPSHWLPARAHVLANQVQRLTKLIDELLNLSRITGGRLDLQPESMDLAALAREVAERYEDELTSAACPFALRAPAPVPGVWDRLRLDQIVTNLLSNAIKYGRGQPIEMTIEQVGDHARLEVRDRGIGIAPADQERIFQRFERAVSDRHYSGFGLGLWIARQLVAALDGTITVESQPGQGATFKVTLPCAARK